jgi:hypothetical protein
MFAVVDPHFLEWVGRWAFFRDSYRELERKLKQIQASVYVPISYGTLNSSA